MPRPLRIEFENAWYHVMNRGTNRQNIFKTSSHRNLFYTLIGEIVEKFKIEVHAFCLMNNHFHLLIKTPYPNLGRAMRHLDGIYTQRFNKTTKQDGPLFRGRYKAILIDSDQYLLQVSRYIHLNPVVAKFCKTPLDYKWSSYRSFVEPKQSIAWLTTATTLNKMQGSNKRSAYKAFMEQEPDEETTKFYNKKHLPSIYGTTEFINQHLENLDKTYTSNVLSDINHTKPIPQKDKIIESVINYFHISPYELQQSVRGKKNIPRMISIFLLSELGQLRYKTISEILPYLHEASIPNLILRFKKLIRQNPAIDKQVREIRNKINQS